MTVGLHSVAAVTVYHLLGFIKFISVLLLL